MSEASALIPAAGRGERLGKGINKCLAPVAGKPILAHTISAFETCDAIGEIVLIVGEGEIATAHDLVSHFGFTKVREIVSGGAQRQDSVSRGLEKITNPIVAIHDGARPMITHKIIIDSINTARRTGACIAAVPVIDTIKSASDGVVSSTLDRRDLYAVQTPQTFRTDLIRQAYAQALADGHYATDDAALVERMGEEVAIVKGSHDNIKITTPSDLEFASMKLGGSAGCFGNLVPETMTARVGIGLDVHAFADGRKLVLGGVEIEFEKGLAGHSDADVLLHAISDAILGAAALGDIGRHFPDTDPAYKGISSLTLLQRVGELVANTGWGVSNIDSVVICERPRIAPHVPEMTRRIADCLAIDPSQVSVKGTTTEHLGFTGRGEGIAAQAIATLRRVLSP